MLRLTHNRYLFLVLLLCAALLAGLAAASPARAQDPQAWAGYDINVRTGPDQATARWAHSASTRRSSSKPATPTSTWMLLRTPDGAVRGWSKSRLFRFADGVSLDLFPVSGEIVAEPAAPPAPGASTERPDHRRTRRCPAARAS